MGIRHERDERVSSNNTGQTTPQPNDYEIDLEILAEFKKRILLPLGDKLPRTLAFYFIEEKPITFPVASMLLLTDLLPSEPMERVLNRT